MTAMKILLKFLTLSICFALTTANIPFEKWQGNGRKRHGSYLSRLEALKNFQVNHVDIRRNNAKFRHKQLSFEVGHNKFSDMDKNEFKKVLADFNDFQQMSSTKSNTKLKVPKLWKAGNVNLTIPEIPIKDQESCGSCWAFAATDLMEYALYMENKTYVDLSEQNCIDCSRGSGCVGGLMNHCLSYYMSNGVNFENVYPYKGESGKCEYKNTKSDPDAGLTNKSAKQWYSIPADEKLMAYIIAEKGWIAASINATDLQFYKSGIIKAEDCSEGPNHAIVLVGYGYDPVEKMDYWIGRNSWGPTWGENGYFRLQRGKNACDVAHKYPHFRAYID